MDQFLWTSSVRRIFKKGGQKLQKIWEEHRSEFEIVILKFRPIFRPKSGDFEPKAWCPTCKGGGGGGHASILLTFLCNFAILPTQRGGSHGPMAPPKYAPALNKKCNGFFSMLHSSMSDANCSRSTNALKLVINFFDKPLKRTVTLKLFTCHHISGIF